MYHLKKGMAPNQAHVDIPQGLHEEEHGRQGFRGPSSHLYRTHPPTGWIHIEGPLRPRAFACQDLSTPDQHAADTPATAILESPDVRVLLSRLHQTMTHFVRNADGDEVYFIHKGSGQFETDYGVLPFEPGDYVIIPKGTTYRIHVFHRDSLFLILESPDALEIPDRGLLGHHALFDLGALTVPEPISLSTQQPHEGGRQGLFPEALGQRWRSTSLRLER